MKRFFIKDDEISFSLNLNEYDSSDECNKVAELVNQGYDSYIDKDTDSTLWIYSDGELVELDYQTILAETQPTEYKL